MNSKEVERIATFLRYFSLKMSTTAGSGHPTSSLSAADLMATFIAEVFRFDLKNPDNPANDRLVFSKGHASPLYYSMFAAMGAMPVSELENYRKFSSNLEGHPTFRFPYTEAATGSLGQGLSIGVGLALALKMQELEISNQLSVVGKKRLKTENRQLTAQSRPPLVFVLLGDGEMAEGSTWEAIEIASKYKLDNLIGILDVNRLGQSDETMLGHDVATYQKRIAAFGWETRVIDGHNYREINATMQQCNNATMRRDKPFMIIAKTFKGKGVSFIEDKNGWHGKPLPPDMLSKAFVELGKVDLKLRVIVKKPLSVISGQLSDISQPVNRSTGQQDTENRKPRTDNRIAIPYKTGDEIATRKAYGEALARLGEKYPQIVALDGDVKNSTYSEIFKKQFPERFFEMYIAEQNMVGAAVGLARRGKIPFVSTFAAFFTRAYDQIRMSALSGVSIKFVGSHAGVSIGEDGPSQMGLEDLSMFRSIYGSTVLYPADAVATEKLVEEMVNDDHIVYMRTTRPNTRVIYDKDEKFPIGGSKTHRLPLKLLKGLKSLKRVVIVAAGITLYEALKAQEELAKDNIEAIVVDAYSVKPFDGKTLRSLVKEISPPSNLKQGPSLRPVVVTVEDHWYEGGIGDAVLGELADQNVRVYKLAVTKLPRSGKSHELLDWEGISAKGITDKVHHIL